MSPENTIKLVTKYPKIFSLIHNPGEPPHNPISLFIFECGDGWYNIIDQLCANIQSHIDWEESRGIAISQVVAEQVKEKFGTLRFYVRGGDEYIDALINMAESMSGVTCEACGKPGTTGGKGWISTMCEEHRK
jgi:hypothetical protein